MAEKVLFNVAGGILGSLAGPLVAEEFRMVLGVKREIEKLQNTVSAIQAVLLHAEELRATNPLVDHWLGRLDDVIYDADDLLDAVSTEVLRRKEKKAGKVRIFFSESNQLAFRFKMGHKIKGIREKLGAIAADLKDFNFVPRLVEAPVRVTRRDDTYSFVLKQHVIGREDDTEEVIRSLLDINIEKSLSILPIVGIGGLGKTTLAQIVFNDERMQNFDLKLWVCVSVHFNVKNIVEKIIKSAKLKPEGDEMEQLVDCLRKEIVTKNFFLVLDDVWNEDCEKWFELKNVLTNDVVDREKEVLTQSKILITTRSGEVARITHTIKPYILRGLREEKSWDLFKKMAFDGEEPENLSIREIGEEIVRKCGGVPLALGAMGRMLSGQNSVKEWEAFRDNQLSKISKRTILSTLKLSYDILPSHLKHCFAYCSLFPKDYKFNKTMLIRLWIAQGFVKLEENRSLEDIGHDYLMELVSRLFFQKAFACHFSLEEDNFEEDIYVFKMHALMHDLAILMAGSLIVTKFDNIGKDAIQKACHISFHDLNNISSLYNSNRSRTLIYFRDRGDDGQLDVEKIISSFKLLRVLILGQACFGLDNIGKLKYLRYLDLSALQISELPNSITGLINLESLILSRCGKLTKLPKEISKLVNLRHLDNFCCYKCHLPREIGQLTNLQTLVLFMATENSYSEQYAGFRELIGLKNLRGKIQFYESWCGGVMGTACESMVMDPKVKSVFNILKLEPKFGFDHRIPFSTGRIRFLSMMTSLVELKINDLKRCRYLPPLCQLPLLEEVHLFKLPVLKYMLGSSYKDQLSSSATPKKFFPSLKFLKIDDCYKLNGWLWSNSTTKAEVDNGGDNSMVEHYSPPMFSCLSKLSITTTSSLISMPVFPDTLEDLSLHSVYLNTYLGRALENRPKAITSHSEQLKQEFLYALENQIPASEDDSSCSVLSRQQSFAISVIESLPMMRPTPLSKLKKLQLSVVLDIETLPMEGLQHLTSLENLDIDSLYNLKSLDLGLLHLTALKSLILCNCPRLEFANDEDEEQWQGLEKLLTVQFVRLSKLVSIPRCLQRAITLENLYIKDCENLTSLPEWICNYKLLKELEIVNCSQLTYLPGEVEKLASLDRIYIWNCPGIRCIIRPPGYCPSTHFSTSKCPPASASRLRAPWMTQRSSKSLF